MPHTMHTIHPIPTVEEKVENSVWEGQMHGLVIGVSCLVEAVRLVKELCKHSTLRSTHCSVLPVQRD